MDAKTKVRPSFQTSGDVRLFLGKFRITPDDAIRERIYQIQVETICGGKIWSAAGIIIVELTEALRELGYTLPNPRLTRQSHNYIMRAQDMKTWTQPMHPRFRRLECSVGQDCRDALVDLSKRERGIAFTETVHNLLMSRINKSIPTYMFNQRTYKAKQERDRTKPAQTVDSKDYDALFLKLCAERKARDVWHRKGGPAPQSTVDDHLGRTQSNFHPDRVANDKNSYISRNK